ncbi:CBM_HP2_G0000870.mRNA.1.CDS.1 [Saccharomyces cerevisiae]|nr:CBM_HP2_G0000870.mRNA.1.CDS.1 [Saccharomyces cerevisiae]CAI6384967.1 CBM_HP2_G0000870.mRNA.1.CDS.1 [Saccharomyces cerevisiae]
MKSPMAGLHGVNYNSIYNRSVLNKCLGPALVKSTTELKFGHKSAVKSNGQMANKSVILRLGNILKTAPYEKYDFVRVVTEHRRCDEIATANVKLRWIFTEYEFTLEVELYIPPTEEFKPILWRKFAAPDHLHIWPRVINSLTGDAVHFKYLFGSKDQISDLWTPSQLREFLMRTFPDIIRLMDLDDAVKGFITLSKGNLVCVNCKPYDVPGGKAHPTRQALPMQWFHFTAQV